MADRMIVMNAGVADQIGAPREVYASPATEFVASFIGSPPTNFLSGALLGRKADIRVGIRPEHTRLSDIGKLKARATFSEALGAETLVHLRCADDTQITVRQDTAAPIPQEGAEVAVDWNESQEMNFDGSGKRL